MPDQRPDEQRPPARERDAADSKEEQQSENRPAVGTRLSAREIRDNVEEAAEEEMGRPVSQLAFSSLAAGLTIGFSVLAGAYLASLVPPPYHHAAAAAGYPLGFIFVVLARSQLFTENTLEPVIPLLHNHDRPTLIALLRLWGVVLPGNLAGALAFALVDRVHAGASGSTFSAQILELSVTATDGGFWLVAFQAVFGGWLVALMAWLVSSTRATGAQIVFVWVTTAPIAAFGFRHSIAGAVEAFFRAAAGSASWSQMLLQFLVPAILGNIVGGVTLVALLNHGQVAEEERPARRW